MSPSEVSRNPSNGDEVTLEIAPEEMRRFGYRVIDSIVEHSASLRDLRVVNVVSREEAESVLREPAPEEGQELDEVIRAFEEKVAPRMSHVDHPRMFGFIPGSGTFVGAMGDALASGYNIYGGTWIESAGASQVELLVVDWFRSWLGMPDSAGGTLVSGGSVANLTGIVVARETLLKDGYDRAVIYTGELAHSSVDRAARILGFRKDQVRKLPLDDRFRLDMSTLVDAVEEDAREGHQPFCVVATAGATSTGTIDPLPELADLCSERGLWLHLDAAYGGFAVLDERGRKWLEGIGRGDSVALDPHKWLYAPFEAGCILVRDARLLYESFCVHPDYLADVEGREGRFNFCDYGIQLSRATRALKIWMPIKHFGLGRYRAVIGRTIDLTSYAEQLLRGVPGIEIVNPATLGVVVFRYVPVAEGSGAARALDDEVIDVINEEIVQRVWASGRAMITSARLRGRYVLRICVTNHTTRRSDVEEIVGLIADLGPAVAAERFI